MTEPEICGDLGVVYCLECARIITAGVPRCPHCNAHLHARIPRSLEKCWLYLITSVILFFPANLLPITYSRVFGQPLQGDTIMSNIVLLWHHGSVGIALIIFFASIFVPFVKIGVLLYLLTHQNPTRPPRAATRWYRIIHFVGRWSMIDVFVVALLGALVQGKLASITPGPGIFAFAAVVIFTILATENYDPRLLWDSYRNSICNTPK